MGVEGLGRAHPARWPRPAHCLVPALLAVGGWGMSPPGHLGGPALLWVPLGLPREGVPRVQGSEPAHCTDQRSAPAALVTGAPQQWQCYK